MKRDMDLVRSILLEVEAHKHGSAPSNLTIDGYNDETIGFHVYLMGQADLLRVADITSRGDASPNAIPLNITWNGYEFLEAARNNTGWQNAKRKVIDSGIGFSIVVLKAVLVELAMERLGLSSSAP